MATVATALLAACTSPLISPDDRKHVCRVAVDEKFGAPVFQPNVLSSPAGGLLGAAAGALKFTAAGPGGLLLTPLGALIGGTMGGACAAASLVHPTADADFERILRAADVGALKRTLEANLNAPRAECEYARTDDPVTAAPDTVVDIADVSLGMHCLLGNQKYWIAVGWRTTVANTGRLLNETTTKCTQTSFRSVGDWFGDPDQAREEIERVLARAGERIARQLLARETSRECKLQSRETGEVVEAR